MSITLAVTSINPDGTPRPVVEKLTFDQPRVVVGRGAHADLRLPSRGVSSTHAMLSMASSELSITDDHSTNGTAVNGVTLVRGRRKILKHQDRIVIPGYEIVVEIGTAPGDPRDRTSAVARRFMVDLFDQNGYGSKPPELLLLTGRRAGRLWTMGPVGSSMRIGRGEPCEITIEETECLRAHAEVFRSEGFVTLRLLVATGTLFVGTRSVTERRLRHGDEIRIGRSVLQFNDPLEEALRTFDAGGDDHAAMTIPPPPPVVVVQQTSVAPPASEESAQGEKSMDPSGVKTDPGVPAVCTKSANSPVVRRGGGADWVVLALALVILAVSATALFVLLRTTPNTRTAERQEPSKTPGVASFETRSVVCSEFREHGQTKTI